MTLETFLAWKKRKVSNSYDISMNTLKHITFVCSCAVEREAVQIGGGSSQEERGLQGWEDTRGKEVKERKKKKKVALVCA